MPVETHTEKIKALVKKKVVLLALLFIITIIGGVIRIYNLGYSPAGFFCDEAATGYNAFSILTTGKDEFGVFMPLFFRSFGNYRPGIPMYFAVPFIAFLGLNEFATRLPSAIIGTMTILSIFFLAKTLLRSTTTAIFSSLFLAVSPWHIQFSRYGGENIYLPFFLSVSIFLFLLAMKKKIPYLLLLSFLLFGISSYTYFQGYYLVPIFLTFLIIIYQRSFFFFSKRILVTCIILFLFIDFPIIHGLTTGETLARMHQVTKGMQITISQDVIKQITRTYIDHFLPEFLFIKGDIGYHTHFITRFSVRGIGELYYLQIPLLFFGLIYLFKKYRKATYLLCFWLLVYPLGSVLALTADGGGPFASRSIIGVIPFQIISALGITWLIILAKHFAVKLTIIICLIFFLFFSTTNYLYQYFVVYPLYSSDFWGWQYGARDIVHYFVKNQSQYDEEIMAPEFNAPGIFFKFYAPNDCLKCKIGLPENSYHPSKRQLFAITPTYLLTHPSLVFKIDKNIQYPNGYTAFYLGEIQSSRDNINNQ